MNQKPGPEESSLWPSHKTGQSKSLQRLNSKKSYEKVSESLKSQGKQRIKKQTSQKSLKSSKFDTPEKKSSPKPLRDFHKSPSSSKLTTCSTPFPSNIQLFSKKNIGKLINNSKLKSKNTPKFNPMHLAPVLNTRKVKESEKFEKSQNFCDSAQDKLIDPQLDQKVKDEIIKEYIETKQDVEIKEEKCEEIFFEYQENEELKERFDWDGENLNETSKFVFYSKVAQPSFGEEFEDDPTFLSDRMSYECESNQSPKFDNAAIKSVHWEQAGKELVRLGKLDSETQTDSDTLEGILGFLNDHDIQTGIRFIAKIARFVQTLK